MNVPLHVSALISHLQGGKAARIESFSRWLIKFETYSVK